MNKPRYFIEPSDDLARLINEKAELLYQQIRTLDLGGTEIDDFGKYYFASHHGGRRLVFSIQSSADIIYNSVKMTGKDIPAISFMDYGAGLGTLFLLAGMLGFKKVYFNDYFPQWAGYAGIVCSKLGIVIDDFISGDIDAVISYGEKNHTTIDIIASRNVLEHIYDLRRFYKDLSHSGITAICYSTTTANYHNPLMRLKHYWHHRQVEKKQFRKQREAYIREQVPGIDPGDLTSLISLTRGRAFGDLTNVIQMYLEKKPLPPVEFLGTNTCDCRTGVWAEHLITRDDYADIVEGAGFSLQYNAGFWDTHYKYAVVNLFTRILNILIRRSGKKAYWMAPFVNVVAVKK